MPDDFHRLLWVMLPLGLDREGRGLDNSAWVKAKVMPLRLDVTPERIEEAICWYAERGMIERYVVRGRHYFQASSFAKYQGNTSKEAASEYPPPPIDSTPDQQDTNSGPTPEQVKSNSGPTPDQGVSESMTEADTDADIDSDSAAARAPDENPFIAWERAAGMLSQIIAADLGDLVDECETHRQGLPRGSPGADLPGGAWVCTAIREMAAAGVTRPNTRYLTAVLGRWRREGYQSDNRQTKPSGNGRGKSKGLEASMQAVREIIEEEEAKHGEPD